MESFNNNEVIRYDLENNNGAQVLLNESGLEYHSFLEEQLNEYPQIKNSLKKLPHQFFTILETFKINLEKLDKSEH